MTAQPPPDTSGVRPLPETAADPRFSGYSSSGTLELAIADAPAQQIKAGRTKTGKGVTLYSGGVEYDNGVFSWKGGRMEVSEKDGVTTLAFRK